MKTAKILERSDLVRDLDTKAILNIDILAVKRHEKRIADLQKEKARDEELLSMKQDLIEIKALLSKLSNCKVSI